MLEEALARGLANGFVYATLGLAYAETGRTLDATKAAYEGAQRAGSDASVLVIAGHALLIAQHPEDAQKVLDAAVKITPRDPEALTRAGMARRALGDKPGARSYLMRALEVDPTYALAKTELAALERGR